MKKLVAVLVVCMMLLSAIPALADHVNPNALPEGSIAKYDQYYEDLNVTRYTPWIRLFHMETPERYAKGIHGGEGGQVVMSIAASPVNPDYVIMGTDTSSAWISHDGGDNWILLDENVNTWSIPDIKWHPTNENIVYMVQGDRGGYSVKTYASTVGGLYRSEDAGLTWKQISTLDAVTPGNQAENLINFDANGNVYYLTSSGLMKSTDEGQTWTCLGKLVADTSVNVEEDNDDENQSSTNTDADSGTATVPTASYSFVAGDNADANLVPDVKRAVFSSYVSPDGQTIAVTLYSGLYLTRDGGATWARSGGDTTGIECYSIAVDPTNANHWVTIYSGNKAYTTTDAGYTWQSMNIATYNNGKYYAAFAKFGAPKADGKPTLFVIFGNMNIPFTFALDGTRTDFNALLEERTTDKSGDWKRPKLVNSDDRFLSGAYGYTCEGFAVCESDPNILYFSFGDVLYRSNDGGITFEKKNSGYSGNYVRQFLFDENNKLWLAFTDKGLGVADYAYDGEKLPTAKMIDYNGTAASVVIDPKDPNHIFTNRGGWSAQTLVESKDGGKTWSVVLDSEGNSLYCDWTILKYIGENTIMSSNYKSTDNGATWVRHTDATGANYHVEAMSNVDNNILYSRTGTNSNQYRRSTDGGQNWRTFTISGNVTEIYPDEFDANTVWIGTYSGTIVKATYSTFTGDATNRIRNGANGIPLINSYDYVSVQVIRQNPNDKNHFVAGGKATHSGLKSYGLIESKDGGTTWYQVKGFKGVMNVNTLEFSPVSTEVFIGTCSNGTLVYDYSKYSPTNNSVIFDMDGLEVEAPKALTGNYGDKVTLPNVTVDETVKFYGWLQEYTAYDFYGNPTQVVKEYAPGDEFVVEYTDMTLKASYKYVTDTQFEISTDGENFEELKRLKSGVIKATVPVTTTGTAVPVLGLYDINNPAKVIKFVIGDAVTVDGSAQVEAEIDLTDVDTTDTILKYFVWNSLDMAAPLRIVEAIK